MVYPHLKKKSFAPDVFVFIICLKLHFLFAFARLVKRYIPMEKKLKVRNVVKPHSLRINPILVSLFAQKQPLGNIFKIDDIALAISNVTIFIHPKPT